MLATLNEIGAAETPQILVLNKIDLIPGEPDAAALARRILGDPEHQPAGAVAISARTGAGIRSAAQKIDETLPLDPLADARFAFPSARAAPLHLLHEHARVTRDALRGASTVTWRQRRRRPSGVRLQEISKWSSGKGDVQGI